MAPVMTQAKIPLLIGKCRQPRGSPTSRLTSARLSHSMWHPAYPMGTYAAKSIGCKTAAMGVH